MAAMTVGRNGGENTYRGFSLWKHHMVMVFGVLELKESTTYIIIITGANEQQTAETAKSKTTNQGENFTFQFSRPLFPEGSLQEKRTNSRINNTQLFLTCRGPRAKKVNSQMKKE